MSNDQYYPLYNLNSTDNLLAYINNMLEHFLVQFETIELQIFKNSNQLAYSFGEELDELAFLYGLNRYATENDEHLRNRIKSTYLYRTPATKNAIKNYFNIMYGFRPLIHEYFGHLFYSPGDYIPKDLKAGYFELLLPLQPTKVQEVNFANSSGNVTPYNFDINSAPVDPPEVYLYTDHAHVTNYATGTITNGDIICSPPLAVGTKVMAYYDVIPDTLFDLVGETAADVYGIYLEAIDRIKAAGVSVDIAYYWSPLHDWFHGDVDDLLLTDYGIQTIIPIITDSVMAYDLGFTVNDGAQYIYEEIFLTHISSYVYAPPYHGTGIIGVSKLGWLLAFPVDEV